MAVLHNRKCSVCGVKNPRQEMHRLELQQKVKRSHIELMLKNAAAMLLAQKPKGISRRSWLFGHYRRTQSRTVKRWHCFECYIRQLTLQEYQLFRNAHHDDLASEKGPAQAEASVARLDALYYREADAG